jgi:hypothetical protein
MVDSSEPGLSFATPKGGLHMAWRKKIDRDADMVDTPVPGLRAAASQDGSAGSEQAKAAIHAATAQVEKAGRWKRPARRTAMASTSAPGMSAVGGQDSSTDTGGHSDSEEPKKRRRTSARRAAQVPVGIWVTRTQAGGDALAPCEVCQGAHRPRASSGHRSSPLKKFLAAQKLPGGAIAPARTLRGRPSRSHNHTENDDHGSNRGQAKSRITRVSGGRKRNRATRAVAMAAKTAPGLRAASVKGISTRRHSVPRAMQPVQTSRSGRVIKSSRAPGMVDTSDLSLSFATPKGGFTRSRWRDASMAM